MEMPIGSILTGKRLDVAKMQDLVVEVIYNYVQPDAVLYGGTAIWRCFNGGRFSEDIDIYVNRSFGSKFQKMLSRYNLSIVSRDKDLPLHMRIGDGTTDVLVEASIGNPESIISQYARIDGSHITISVLSPAELLVRKIEAYRGRRYVRDIYDIFQLTNFLDKHDYYVTSHLRPFLKDLKEPVDEDILESLIYKGIKRLTFKKIVNYLKAWSS